MSFSSFLSFFMTFLNNEWIWTMCSKWQIRESSDLLIINGSAKECEIYLLVVSSVELELILEKLYFCFDVKTKSESHKWNKNLFYRRYAVLIFRLFKTHSQPSELLLLGKKWLSVSFEDVSTCNEKYILKKWIQTFSYAADFHYEVFVMAFRLE